MSKHLSVYGAVFLLLLLIGCAQPELNYGYAEYYYTQDPKVTHTFPNKKTQGEILTKTAIRFKVNGPCQVRFALREHTGEYVEGELVRITQLEYAFYPTVLLKEDTPYVYQITAGSHLSTQVFTTHGHKSRKRFEHWYWGASEHVSTSHIRLR